MKKHQSVLPSSQPHPPISRLKHTESIEILLTTQVCRFKLIVQAVEPLHNGEAPIGNSPDLIAVVDKDLSHSTVRFLKIIMPRITGIRHILQNTLFRCRNPQVALLILDETRHGRMDIYRQSADGMAFERE